MAAIGVIAGMVGLSNGAEAATECSLDAIAALHVPDVSVTEAKPVASSGSTPAHCDVQGTVVTKGAGVADGLARFAMQLPDAWQHRFLFLGVGGNAGNLRPSANAVDRASALGKGYVTVLTDTGHEGDGTSAKWTLGPDGKPDLPKRTDFFHRAAHDVTIAGKALSEAFYAGKVEHAYFDGCSTGGRMAMMEAERYPTDYEGVIAGDPMMSFHTYTARAVVQRAALTVPAAYISPELLKAIDARVTGRCDAIDGAKDGLVQSSAACPVRAQELICKPGETAACLNKDQARVLESYTSPFRDRRGRVVFGPWPITDMADPQGVGYTVTGRAAPDLSDLSAPWKADPEQEPRAWALVQEMVAHWLALGPKASVADLDVDGQTNTVGDKMLALMKKTYAEGEVRDPRKLAAFLAQGRKMILYHGTSDPSIPPSQSIAFYNELRQQRGSARNAASVRLFLVPDMHHCSGGPGPDQFDTLSALEDWVERGKPPAAIQASTRPDSPAPHRLPLCPYPQQGRFSGGGSMADPANWQCR
ncbi:MAG: tannase/feruloyl esterase family alpha/beta hydrolase [Acetobacteraceae bacterium]|nr:tannase/feruloyl esterase family alpha/beta hydrolase [Acetobacteraceae bacterium]